MSATPVVDVAAARADTLGCAVHTHLDNAGASLPPRGVVDAVVAHLRREEELGGYAAEDASRELIDDAYDACADLIGATRDEIALVESATTAWQLAFDSIRFTRGDRILTCIAEYASNYIGYLRLARQLDIAIDVVPDDEHGQIDVEQAAAMVTDRTRLIAITHVPTNGGLVNPAEAIGAIARERGVTYLLDACQSTGQLPIDVGAIGCDFLSFTGRKYLRAPWGTGALFARSATSVGEPTRLDVHSATWVDRATYRVRTDARRFETFESNVAAKIGLGVAARYALHIGIDASWARIQHLANRLRHRLREIHGVTLRDKGFVQCGIVTFTVDGIDASAVKAALGNDGVTVSVTQHAFTVIDMTQRELESMVRASVHYFNTDDEIDRTAEAVASIARGSVQRLR